MYAKVFSQILDSSIAENYSTRHVFMDLLVLANKDGIVDMTPYAISRRTNVPLNMIQTAIDKLSSPDADSRSSSQGGRRIILIDPDRTWGWKIVNYVNYCKLRDENTRQEYMRDYMKRRREKEKDALQTYETKDLLTSVNTCKPQLANVPVPVSIKSNTKKPKNNACRIPEDFSVTDAHRKFAFDRKLSDPDLLVESFKDHWTASADKGSMKLDWDAAFRTWIRNDKKFNGGTNGAYKQSATKQRVDASRSRLAQAAINRGLINFDSHDGISGQTLPLAGFGK